MELYSVDRSPFGARVRAIAYFKGLDLPSRPPPGGDPKTPAFLAVNPLGKLPALVLDSGVVIPESEVIVDYLEQAFPTPAATPSNLEERASARLLARIAELYVLEPLFGLFPQLNPATQDLSVVEASFAALTSGLGQLETFMAPGPYAAGATFTLADAMVTPTLFWVDMIHAFFGRHPADATLPKMLAYRIFARSEPILGRVWREMATDLEALRGARGT